ncbi:MAG TPA: hypothetical protein VGF25_17055 [Thermoleophilaceae bacterium]
MEIVKILRTLWHRRVLVGAVALLAIVVGVLLAYHPGLPPKSRKYEVGIATVRILVDTPKTVIAEVNPKGSETLGSRASVITNVMAEGEVKAAIARHAGLRPAQLHAVAAAAIEPSTLNPKDLNDPEAHLLTIGVLINSDGMQLPIIKIDAQAPDVAGATKLANAAVSGLREYLDSKAASEKISNARRLRVTGLGPAQARVQVRGPGRLVALAAMLFIFLGGCGAILLGSALARGWRQAAAEEAEDIDSGGPAGGPATFFDGKAPVELFSSDRGAADPTGSDEPWDLPADPFASTPSVSGGDADSGRAAKTA